MADRAEAAAEAQKASLGPLRLQKKFNCVRGYEALGVTQEEYAKEEVVMGDGEDAD